jgi:hypothetical protein
MHGCYLDFILGDMKTVGKQNFSHFRNIMSVISEGNL